jgi:hypothetical protein
LATEMHSASTLGPDISIRNEDVDQGKVCHPLREAPTASMSYML